MRRFMGFYCNFGYFDEQARRFDSLGRPRLSRRDTSGDAYAIDSMHSSTYK